MLSCPEGLFYLDLEAVGADLLPMPVAPEGILIKEELPQLEE